MLLSRNCIFKKFPSKPKFSANTFSKNFSSFDTSNYKNTNLSFCSGPTGVQLITHPIGEVLKSTAKNFPYITALISAHQNKFLTWTELDRKVDMVAMNLISLGLPVGSKIGVYAPNSEEWLLIQLACARAGYILVNINPAYQVNDLKYVLNKIEVNTLIMTRMFKSSNYIDIVTKIAPSLKDKKNKQDPRNLNLPEMPQLRQIILLDDSCTGEAHTLSIGELDNLANENSFLTWTEFMELYHKADLLTLEKEFNLRKENVKSDDCVNIQFTSGTTGLPKGAMLSHMNIVNNGFLVGRTLEYNQNDRVLIQVPLYHCFGAVMGNLACITHGSTIIYPNGHFEANKSLNVLSKFQATSLYGVPTMFLDILNTNQKLKHGEDQKMSCNNSKIENLENKISQNCNISQNIQNKSNSLDLSTLKKGIMAGSICPKYLMDRCINELNLTNLTICYGMTELSPVTHQTSIHDTMEKKTTTVGSLLPHTTTKIVDDDGKILPRGSTGEICTRSYGLMLGYYGDENATNEAIRDGFMHTGDLGYIDQDGYLHIEGRKKDTIIRGGENISPKELEDFLGTHPMIDDVQVVGARDEKFGDEICAWIKIKEVHKGKVTKDEIIHYCKKQIAHYKIPRYVRFVEHFPMTVTGKPQKFKMREITNQILQDKSENL
jgi:fatty-acyl-CoA synthase